MSSARKVLLPFVILLIALASAGVWAGPESPLQVELDMPHVPSLGQEATVGWTILSHYPFLKGATLTIDLPKGVELVEGNPTWTGDLTLGLKATGTIKVKAVRPGNKRIQAIVFAKLDSQNSFSDTAKLYFHSDKDKGQRGRVIDFVPYETDVVTASGDVIEPTRLSDYKPGPDQSSMPAPCNIGPGEGAVMASSEATTSSMLTVSGRWRYYDRNGAERPLAWVQVELLRGNDQSVLATSYVTDDDGRYTFPAITNPGSDGFYVRAKTYFSSTYSCDGNAIRVHDAGHNDYVAYSSFICRTTNTAYSIGTSYILHGSANEPAWWVMQDLVKCFWWPYNHKPDHSSMAGGVTCVWYPGSTDGDHYHIGGEIHLTDGAADFDCTPMHEYGHAVQYDIYGGWLPSTDCPSPHFVEQESGPNCAWVEGFASWYRVVVSGDPVYRWPGGGVLDYESPTWDTWWDQGDGVEGRVTSAMWDMIDSEVDGLDACDLTAKDIWEVIYGHRDNNFSEFWSRWKNMGKPKHEAVKAVYQNTIDYNTWPTLTGIPDEVTMEDVALPNTLDLRSYASDVESSDSELTYTIANWTNVMCGVSIDSGGFVDVDPEPNWNGYSDVTIRCSDGIRSREDTFRITVNPTPDAPLISGLPDKMLTEGGSLNNAIDLWNCTRDPETADALLTYTITGNTSPSCGVTIDSNHYIDINPSSKWYGYSDVTIRATDPGGLWTEDTFRITVSASNDAPVFGAVPPYVMNEDHVADPAIDLWLYASDDETPHAGLVFTITSSTDTNCGAVISSGRYVSFHPATQWSGTSEVIVRVTDTGSLWDETKFKVTVNPVNDPPVLSTLPFVIVYLNQPRDNVIDLWAHTYDLETADSGLSYAIVGSTNPSCGVRIDSNRYIDASPSTGWTGSSIVTIRTTDPSGAWDEESFEAVVGESCSSIAEVRNRPSGSWVILPYRPVTARFSNSFYVEENPGRTSGIRVSYPTPPAINKRATVVGQTATYYAERVIDAHWVGTYFVDETNPPLPLAMSNGTLGGSSPDPYTLAVPTKGVGLYNVGLLVRTTGRVQGLGAGSRYFIADGSSVVDCRITSNEPWLLVESVPSGWCPPVGANVTITGISGASTLSGTPIRVLRPRNDGDIIISGLNAVYIRDLDNKAADAFKGILQSSNINTTIMTVSQIAGFDFSPYHVVIIGPDTDAAWTIASRVSAVVGANLPIVAVGLGGAYFLDAVTDPDLYIGKASSSTTSNETLGVVAGGSIYSYPSAIPYSTGLSIPLYVSPGVSMQSLLDAKGTVTHLLGKYGDAIHFPVVAEADRFYMWGYDASASKMTDWGKKLFVNLVFSTLRQ